MTLKTVVKKATNAVRSNATTILPAIGVGGVLSTAYLAAKASFKASDVIRTEQMQLDLQEKSHPLTNKEKAKLVWKEYIPTAVSGVLTIGCIIGGARIGARRAAAAYSLIAASEQAFSSYREKVVEQIGEKKERAIRDELAQDRLRKDPPTLVVGTGKTLCREDHTGRYFECDIETLRRAENKINHQMLRENEASLNDFYHLVGLPHTSFSSCTGWSIDKELSLWFTAALTEDGKPCLVFEYNYIKPL